MSNIKIITIRVDADKLPKHTDKEFRDWLSFEVGETGGISLENPLVEEEINAEVESITEW